MKKDALLKEIPTSQDFETKEEFEIKEKEEYSNDTATKKIINSMVLNNQMKIGELSKQHRILLVFIKFFGCPM
jgi:hypothetical protein